MSSFDRRTFEDYHSVSNPIESEDNAAYSMIQLFEREYNKTIEAANKSYKVDEEKLKVYYDEEKDIRVDFYEERSKINREIEDEYVDTIDVLKKKVDLKRRMADYFSDINRKSVSKAKSSKENKEKKREESRLITNPSVGEEQIFVHKKKEIK